MKACRMIVVYAVIVLVTAMCLCGCASQTIEEERSVTETREEHILDDLSGIPVSFATVSEENGAYSLNVSIGTAGKVASFGDYILATREAFEAEFSDAERGNFTVSMAVSQGALLRFSGDDYSEDNNSISGLLSDTRSGTAKLTQISTIDDLFAEFPAAQIYADDHGIE